MSVSELKNRKSELIGRSATAVELTQAFAVPRRSAQYHSQQAMAAARKMRQTKRKQQKQKTGQMVCHHLRMMLNSEPDSAAPDLSSASSKMVAANESEGSNRELSQFHLSL